ncbi:MAG TPA: DUF3108 domain-containing protein [Oxalobacteraceae bacterium]|nr:DUF3108 domain-containing protein [Oxalobacteraceae bacterium]
MNLSIALRNTMGAMLACATLTAVAADAGHTALKRKFSLPPSADLSYSIRARQSGLKLDGDAILKWHTDGSKFTVETESRAMLVGKILDAKSEGGIDEYGLAPATFVERRFRKDPTTTTFDHAANTISFSASATRYPIVGGEQDRNSAIWQLIAVARAARGKFKPGSEWLFFVAGQHDAEPWTFRVDKQETVHSPLGNMIAMHVVKAPPPDAKGQQLDIWLAPSLEWYPVRLRYTEPDGDFIEQTLETVSKQAH